MAEKSISEIVDLASAYYGSAVLFAALDVGVFAAVEKSGKLADIASYCHSSVRGMRLLLDACVAEGLLGKNGDEYFNTPSSRMALVPGGKADLTRAIRYNRDVYPAWGKLKEFVLSGNPVEKPEIHLGEDTERTKDFAASMFSRAFGIGRGVVPMMELKGRVLDLAGGPGAYAILMAKANENISVVTMDLPAISGEAEKYVEQHGLKSRIECRKGDYHVDEYEEASYDVVTIFGALHQESPNDIVDILKRAHKALKKGGKIYILDMMTDATHCNPTFSALFAVNMALTTENGWVFSYDELSSYLSEAGFSGFSVTNVPPPMPHALASAIA
jgi:ubiquinone/menaquinone biosynthesis C-methylase UbiE